MPRDARIDVEDMDHSNLNIALECIAAIAAKARMVSESPIKVVQEDQSVGMFELCYWKSYLSF